MLNLGLEFTKLKRRSFLLSLIVIIIVELVWISVVINHELANTLKPTMPSLTWPT